MNIKNNVVQSTVLVLLTMCLSACSAWVRTPGQSIHPGEVILFDKGSEWCSGTIFFARGVVGGLASLEMKPTDDGGCSVGYQTIDTNVQGHTAAISAYDGKLFLSIYDLHSKGRSYTNGIYMSDLSSPGQFEIIISKSDIGFQPRHIIARKDEILAFDFGLSRGAAIKKDASGGWVAVSVDSPEIVPIEPSMYAYSVFLGVLPEVESLTARRFAEGYVRVEHGGRIFVEIECVHDCMCETNYNEERCAMDLIASTYSEVGSVPDHGTEVLWGNTEYPVYIWSQDYPSVTHLRVGEQIMHLWGGVAFDATFVRESGRQGD